MVTDALTKSWHVLVQKSIDLNRELNRIWLYLEVGVRYHNKYYITKYYSIYIYFYSADHMADPTGVDRYTSGKLKINRVSN